MSHRTTLPNSDNGQSEPTSGSPGAEVEPKKRKVDLSVSQIVGGALAAMTAAALGSTLGVAGTIAGAALASIVAGVAGSLYTASLRTGREKVMTVFNGRTSPSPAGSTALPPPPPDRPRSRSRARVPWRRAVAMAAVVFVVAAVLVSVYEVITGHALSGGTGTTISQVQRGSSNSSPPAAKASPSAGAGTSSPSPTSASSSPSAGPQSAAQSTGPSAPASSQAAPSSNPTAGVASASAAG